MHVINFLCDANVEGYFHLILKVDYILYYKSKQFLIDLFAVFVTDKPGIPAAFDITDITNESCYLAWNAPRDDGGSPVTNYIVEMRPLDKEEWQKLSATVKQTTFKACKLVSMKEYVFRVSAENQYGIGTPIEHPPIVAKYSFGRYLPKYSLIV